MSNLAGTIVANSCLRWRNEDENFLKKEWNNLSRAEIASKLGRSIDAVSKKAYNLRLIPAKPGYLRPPPKYIREPIDWAREQNLRVQGREGYLNYLRAIVKANDGCSWGGHLSSVTYNAVGSSR